MLQFVLDFLVFSFFWSFFFVLAAAMDQKNGTRSGRPDVGLASAWRDFRAFTSLLLCRFGLPQFITHIYEIGRRRLT